MPDPISPVKPSLSPKKTAALKKTIKSLANGDTNTRLVIRIMSKAALRQFAAGPDSVLFHFTVADESGLG